MSRQSQQSRQSIGKSKNTTITADKAKQESNAALLTQSTAADGINLNQQFNDCESVAGNLKKQEQKQLSGAPTPLTADDDVLKQADDQKDKRQAYGGNKSFSFVSVVLEPSKKNAKSMKQRDKTKPLIHEIILNKQIMFQQKLIDYQKQMNMQSIVEFDNEINDQNPKRKKSKKGGQQQLQLHSKVQRGNLGFCFLDMSLINLCGVPSLWMDSKQYATSGSILQNGQMEPYIKPYQKKLLKKQYKVYELLKFHKLFENEKYFGKTMNYMHHNQTIFQDYYYFSTDFLKDNQKFQVQQLQKMWDESSAIDAQNGNQQKEKHSVLHIVQSSLDVVSLELPKITDPEPAYFKLLNSEAKILKQILTSQGIQLTDQNEWNLLWTCVSLQNKPQIYDQMLDYQKINHFQNSTELTRKDRFSENIGFMKSKYGFNQFDFAPETYQLPEETQLFQERFNQIKKQIQLQEEKAKNNGQSDELNQTLKEDNLWIVKPSQSSQGRGIYIIDDLNDLQITPNEKSVVCKYISNPLLINNHKFDLRIYVLLTCIDPLRIYIYNEGLARFASEPYDNSKQAMKNLYQHLTNYSINKKSESFQQNRSVLERDHGNKWSLSALQTHFEKMGINMQPIWERIYDAIIKSIISVEHHLLAGVKKIQNSCARQNCFELYGFDILLDSNFKPHILEVNFSPSLSADSPLDYHIKSNILVDTLNMVGIKRNPRKRGNKNGPQRFRGGLNINTGSQNMGFIQVNQSNQRTRETKSGLQKSNSNFEMRNFTQFLAQGNIDQYFLDRLSRISAKHRELVFETLDEFQRNKNMNYTCIFPAAGCHQYDKYFEQPRVSNQLIHRYLFTKNELYTLTKQISDFQKQYLKQKGDGISEQQRSEENSEKSEDEQSEQSPSPSPDPHQLSDQEKDQSQTTSKLKKRRIQITESSPRVNNRTKSCESESQKSPQKTSEQSPIKRQPSPSVQALNEKESEQDTNTDIISKRPPSPMKTLSPNQKMSSRSPSPINIQVEKSPDPKELSKTTNDKEESDSKFNSIITSPKESIQREIQEIVELASPDVSVNKVVADVRSTKIKSRNDTATKSTVIHTSKNKKSKSKLGSNAALSQQSQTFDNARKSAESQIVSPQTTKKEDIKIEVPEITLEKQPSNNNLTVTEDIKSQNNLKVEAKKSSSLNMKSNSNTSPSPTPSPKPKEITSEASKPQIQEKKKEKQKMVITGDDILIEYVSRIGKLFDNFHHLCQQKTNQPIERVDEIIPQQLRITLEKFTRHKIWSNKLSSQDQQLPLVNRLKMRHTEMVERRMKILKALLKKQNASISPIDIEIELKTQDTNRDKIVNRISSQKIEKMVKQSNIENQIDIVSILVEGTYTLPTFMQTSGGKNTINGTLSSLKLFEKILKSDDSSILPNMQKFDQTPLSKYHGKDFRSETKQRENQSSILVSQIQNNNSNQKLGQMYKESKYFSQSGNNQNQTIADQSLCSDNRSKMQYNNQSFIGQGINQQTPMDPSKKKTFFSGSMSGAPARAPILADTNKTFDGMNEIIGAVNSYLSTGSNNRDPIENGSQNHARKLQKHSIILSATHQKNSQSFINPEPNTHNESYFGKADDTSSKQQTFDKRQRSYRNETNQIIKTKSSLAGRENEFNNE